jgi:transcriptional regulator with XRE-family HTH domain
MGIQRDTYVNWETGKNEPVVTQLRPVLAFLGYDPSPVARTLADRLEAKRRSLGVTVSQVARHLGWDPGSLRRYLNGAWRISLDRREALEAFLDADDGALAGVHSLKRRR